MPRAGDFIEGADGFKLVLLRTGAETDGELLEMEATYGGDAPPPPEHLHPRQDEHFDVLKGRVRTVIGGTERVYEVGESFDVPARTPPQVEALGPARLRWEVCPALRTAAFFERLYGAGGAE